MLETPQPPYTNSHHQQKDDAHQIAKTQEMRKKKLRIEKSSAKNTTDWNEMKLKKKMVNRRSFSGSWKVYQSKPPTEIKFKITHKRICRSAQMSEFAMTQIVGCRTKIHVNAKKRRPFGLFRFSFSRHKKKLIQMMDVFCTVLFYFLFSLISIHGLQLRPLKYWQQSVRSTANETMKTMRL